jgi:2Fe-2S ferredoxin
MPACPPTRTAKRFTCTAPHFNDEKPRFNCEPVRITWPICQNKSVPKVTFVNYDRTVEFESGKLPFSEHGKPESLLDIALNFDIPLDHACGGSCACTTCHVWVKNGTDKNLLDADDDELDRLDTAADLSLHSRLGCQAVVTGDVVVEIPAWNRNYVSEIKK